MASKAALLLRLGSAVSPSKEAYESSTSKPLQLHSLPLALSSAGTRDAGVGEAASTMVIDAGVFGP
jgi:hypothetical protein